MSDLKTFAKNLSQKIELKAIPQYNVNLMEEPWRNFQPMEHGDSKYFNVELPWGDWRNFDYKGKPFFVTLTLTSEKYGVKSLFSSRDFEITINVSPYSKAIDVDKIQKRIKKEVNNLVKFLVLEHKKKSL